MNDAGVAKRYAQALFMLAEETASIDKYGQDLGMVCEVIDSNAELKNVYTGVQFANMSKKNVVTEIFKNDIDGNVLNFVLLLVDKMRAQYIFDIYKEYMHLVDEKNGIADATVYTAYPLKESDLDAIAKSLGEAVGKTIRLKEVEDKSLLAGVKLQYGDRIIDGSAKARLESMRKRLVTQELSGGEGPQ